MDVGFSRGFRDDFRISIITSATKIATAFAKINALVHFFLGFKKFDRTMQTTSEFTTLQFH